MARHSGWPHRTSSFEWGQPQSVWRSNRCHHPTWSPLCIAAATGYDHAVPPSNMMGAPSHVRPPAEEKITTLEPELWTWLEAALLLQHEMSAEVAVGRKRKCPGSLCTSVTSQGPGRISGTENFRSSPQNDPSNKICQQQTCSLRYRNNDMLSKIASLPATTGGSDL